MPPLCVTHTLSLELTCFTIVVLSSCCTVSHPPTQPNASCPTVPSQLLIMASASKRQLDEKCYPFPLPERGPRLVQQGGTEKQQPEPLTQERIEKPSICEVFLSNGEAVTSTNLLVKVSWATEAARLSLWPALILPKIKNMR